ncbi:hypothetical protein Q9L58_010637, partial [Maublancomyces gigas]
PEAYFYPSTMCTEEIIFSFTTPLFHTSDRTCEPCHVFTTLNSILQCWEHDLQGDALEVPNHLVDETRSPVLAYFVNHLHFLDYNTTASPDIEFPPLARQRKTPVDCDTFHATFPAEFKCPLDSFFIQYPELVCDPRGAHMAEFGRLVAAKGWDPECAKHKKHAEERESIEYNTARTAFFHAFCGKFNYLFGGNGGLPHFTEPMYNTGSGADAEDREAG